MKCKYNIISMKYLKIYISAALLAASVMTLSAQNDEVKRFAIKATADFGIAKTLDSECTLPGMTGNASIRNYGLDFGWTFWHRQRHSLEANIGLGVNIYPLKAYISKLDYSYQVPAEADMDGEPYIRYYELTGLRQKITTEWITVPLYLNYRYKLSDRVSLHGLFGFKAAFYVSGHAAEMYGESYSYGVYPQYNDLMMDAPYKNWFGTSTLDYDQVKDIDANKCTVSCMVGAGAEVNIVGPLSAALTVKYEGGLNNSFPSFSKQETTVFDAENAPVTYTVSEGQQVKALSGYLSRSKISRLSIALSLLYRF